MQRACIHAHSVAKESRRPAKVSTTTDLPARCTVPRMGEPERPKVLMDASDTRVRTHSEHCEQLDRPENMSATPDLSARGAEPHVGKPEWLESQMDTSNACTHAQRVVNDSRRSENEPERISTPQNGWMKSNLPGRKPELRSEEPEARNDMDASGTHTRAQSSNRHHNG